MKRIFLSFVFMLFSANAAQQYTEAECILLKHQITDEKRKYASNNAGFYSQTQKNYDTYCNKPIVVTRKSSSSIPSSKSVPITTVTNSHTVKTQVNTALPQTILPIIGDQGRQTNSIFLPIFLFLCVGLMTIYYFKKRLPQIKGRIGEKYVRRGLVKQLDNSQYTILNDVTLPLEDGGTTQLDHIVVSPFGIFVIETKNMSGWIFGNEHQPQWTQTIHRTKHCFQNPLRQNYKHTKTLAYLLDLPHEQCHSVVIFTENASLKTKMPVNVGYLHDMLTYIKTFNNFVIDKAMMLNVVSLIEDIKLTAHRKTNKNHVNYLKEKHNSIT